MPLMYSLRQSLLWAALVLPVVGSGDEPGVDSDHADRSVVRSDDGLAAGSVRPAHPASDWEGEAEPPQAAARQLPEDVSCGVAAAYLLLQRLGRPVELERLLGALPAGSGERPMSMAELKRLFERLGLRAAAYRMPLERVNRPVIAYFPGRQPAVAHFVVAEPLPVRRADHAGAPARQEGELAGDRQRWQRWFLVLDPSRLPVRVPAEQLARRWDGRVLVVWAEGEAPPRPAGRRWPLYALAIGCAALVTLLAWLRAKS